MEFISLDFEVKTIFSTEYEFLSSKVLSRTFFSLQKLLLITNYQWGEVMYNAKSDVVAHTECAIYNKIHIF